jgi:hypothetical protein
VRAREHKHRLAQMQARQVKGKTENRYVIKVIYILYISYHVRQVLKWNSSKLHYSTVELGYKHTR